MVDVLDCKETRAQLASYLHGELDAELSHALGKHLRSCSQCRRNLREMVQILAPLSGQRDGGAPQQSIRRRRFRTLLGRAGGRRRMRGRMLFLAAIGIAALTWSSWYPRARKRFPAAPAVQELPPPGEWLGIDPEGWAVYHSPGGHQIALEPTARVRVICREPEVLWWEAGELRVAGSGRALRIETSCGRIEGGGATFAARWLRPGVEVRVEAGFARVGNALGEVLVEGGHIARMAPSQAPVVSILERGSAGVEGRESPLQSRGEGSL